jgi:hypothetical protein
MGPDQRRSDDSTLAGCSRRDDGSDANIGPAMIPAGYLAKRVIARPDWLHAERVARIYSVSGCVSQNFADYVPFWKHNGYWLFDSPQAIVRIARENEIDLAGTSLFFYEVYEEQFDKGAWTRFDAESSFLTQVTVPDKKAFEGYDVVTFWAQTSPEHSPLSCNGVAAEVATNKVCLVDSFYEARSLIEIGAFDNSEPGPLRIFAVYSVAWPGSAERGAGPVPPPATRRAL